VIEPYALFFGIGAVVCTFAVVWNVVTWFRLADNFQGTMHAAFGTIFSMRIMRLVKAFLLDSMLFVKLSKEKAVRSVIISTFLISYVGLILINHLMAEVVPKISPSDPISVFLYAPFLPSYFFEVVPTAALGLTANAYGFLDNLFLLVIVFGEVTFAFRRFVRNEFRLKVTFSDISAIAVTVAWLLARTVGESLSLLENNVPASVGGYWFVAYGISQILKPSALNWSSAAYLVWSLSGFLLGLFMVSIPLNPRLWHIFTAPLIVLASSVEDQKIRIGRLPVRGSFSVKQLVEIDGCLSCGVCADSCEVYYATKNPGTVYLGILKDLRAIMRRRYGLVARILKQRQPTEAEVTSFANGVFYCTLCGRCKEVCPIGIDTRSLGRSIREMLVSEKHYPANFNVMRNNVKETHNIVGMPNSERAMWTDYLPSSGDQLAKKVHAEVAYFVGCMSSYSPAVQDIPLAISRILQNANVDFALLGENEWCCGYPLVSAGMRREAEELKHANIKAIHSLGVKTVVFSCPSCYHMWKTEYEVKDVELLHHTEYILRLIREGKLHLNPVKITVTYHDPCDLGRSSGVYDAPREVIRSIPGLVFVEMRYNREKALCCGGGGDVELVNEKFPSVISNQLILLGREVGADAIVTACQQCERTMLKALQNEGSKQNSLKVLDLSELLLTSIGS